ncbi:MAG TPA: sigma-70 family RNA polymerase sigma factor [Rhodanobacteraceae bacterium]|nr:sigma-70 family RNA polymerase sigma factor [Rhodanobacteraceae bacterium]
MSRFETTRWSLVLKARADAPDARTALEALCRSYRPPVLAYVRSRGYAPEAADDLVQGFFERFLDRAWHAGADSERGRFRAYLLTMLKRYLSNVAIEARAHKRGGDARIEPLDDADGALEGDDTPDRSFERAWAVTLLGRALARLRSEADEVGKAALFDALKEFLVERPDEADYARVAAKLGMRRNTLAVSVHRLRHRLRQLIEDELAETTGSEPDLEAEFAHLRTALGAG